MADKVTATITVQGERGMPCNEAMYHPPAFPDKTICPFEWSMPCPGLLCPGCPAKIERKP